MKIKPQQCKPTRPEACIGARRLLKEELTWGGGEADFIVFDADAVGAWWWGVLRAEACVELAGGEGHGGWWEEDKADEEEEEEGLKIVRLWLWWKKQHEAEIECVGVPYPRARK